MKQDMPLAGVRVLELSTFVCGPTAARLLSDMGAEVIKVESLTGDSWRRSGINFLPYRFEERENPIFDLYNSGKKHVALNLKSADGMEIFQKLLGQADVLVTNIRSTSLKKLGLSYEDLKETYPRLIYASVLGYGEKGPDAGKPAFDTTAFWARSGFIRDMSAMKEDYEPVLAPIGVGDTATAYLLVAEINAALYRRERTGKGDNVSSGLYQNAIFCMGTMIAMAQAPFGRCFPYNRVDHGAPEGSYQCSDGEWVYFALGDPLVNIPRLLRLIGHPELVDDIRFTPENRWENRYELHGYLQDAFLQKPADEWVRLGDEYDLPLVRVAHFKEIAEDPQAWANGYLERVSFPNGHEDTVPASPVHMDSVGAIRTRPAPPCGADTADVLRQLGYSDGQIVEMKESGAIGMTNQN